MKTKGSVDRVRRRKTRSDKGKKRETYAGKKTKPRRKKNGRYVPYVSKRKYTDPIKVEFWKVEDMPNESLMNWNPKIRRHVHRQLYGTARLYFTVNPESISSEEKIEDLISGHLWEGVWHLKFRATKRNKGHNSPLTYGVIKIKETPEGFKYRINPNYNSRKKHRSMKRMFFWRGS